MIATGIFSFSVFPIVKAQAYGGWNYDGYYWQYYDDYGYYTTGWMYDGGCWYYFDEAGDMITGWSYDSWGDWYYFHDSGEMATGWTYIDGAWYFFDMDTGIMAYNTYIDGEYVDCNGVWVY